MDTEITSYVIQLAEKPKQVRDTIQEMEDEDKEQLRNLLSDLAMTIGFEEQIKQFEENEK